MLMSILFSGFTKSKVHCCEQHVFIGRIIFHDLKYPGDCCLQKQQMLMPKNKFNQLRKTVELTLFYLLTESI